MTGYQGFSSLAVPISGKGINPKTSSGEENWELLVPSPILYDGLLYFTQSNQAILSCVDAKTGKVLRGTNPFARFVQRLRFPGWSG